MATPSVANAASNQVAAASVTVTIAATNTGRALVVFSKIGGDAARTVTSVTDSAGTNTWVQVGGSSNYATNSQDRLAVFYALNTDSVTTVTVNWSGSSATVAGVLWEVSGAATTNAIDGVAANTTCSSCTSLTSGSLSTTNANDLLAFGVGCSVNVSWTAGSPFGIPAGGTASRLGTEQRGVSAIQSGTTASMSFGSSATEGIFFAISDTPISTSQGFEDDSFNVSTNYPLILQPEPIISVW